MMKVPPAFSSTLGWCWLVVGSVFGLAGAQAGMIGLHFTGMGVAVTGTAGAPGYEQAHWNNTTQWWNSSFGTKLDLVDDQGKRTTAVLSDYHSAFVGTFNALDTQNKILLGGFLGTYLTEIGSTNDHLTVVTIRNVPYEKYRVVVYSDSGNDVDVVTQVRVGGRSIFLRDPAGVQFDGVTRGFVEVPSTSGSDLGSSTPQGNYAVFAGLTDPDLEIRVAGTEQQDPAHPFGILSAIQIVKESADRDTIIGPEPSGDSQWFESGNPARWQQVLPVQPQMAIVAEGAAAVFPWPGSPAQGYVESTERLTLDRGEGDEVRVVFEIALEDPEYELLVKPVLRQFDAGGADLGVLQMPLDWLYPLNQPTAPGHFRRMAFKAKPAAAAVKVAPGLEFLGNAAKVSVRSIRLEPVEPKPITNPGEPGASRAPQVRYDRDGAVPQEDTPVLSPSEVSLLLAGKSWAEPELERKDGRVKLTVNQNEIPFAIHMAPLGGPEAAHYREMGEIGFKIATLTVKTGPAGDTPGAISNIWTGSNSYNFAPIAAGIRHVLARAPESVIMLQLIVNVYHDWGGENPGDVHANVHGEKAVCNWNRVVRYGGAPPSGNEFWEASNHSRRFREDGAKMLRDLGQWLQTVPEGKVVIGAYINGSADGQWLFSNEEHFADYSPGALSAFRTYLLEKYADNLALSTAWGYATSPQTATIPSYEERRRQKGPDPQVGRSPLMEHNGESAQASDYNAFLSMSNTRRQIAFSKAFKEGSGGRLLAGSYWPTLPAAYPLSHTDFIEMLEAEDVNFISRGGLLGAVFHGKQTAGEFDLRNVKSGLDAWLDYDHPFIPKSQAEFRRQVLGGFCRELAAGGGFHLWDMWGGWFWHPDTLAILEEGLALAGAVKDPPALGENYVGVFIDDDAANFLASLGRSYNQAAVERTFASMGWGWASGWERTGLPVRFFVQEDALNPALVLPRVAVFLNPLTMEQEQAEAIEERFCGDGRAVVYMLAPGLAAPGDPLNPQRITGFTIAEDARTINRPLVFASSADPLLNGIRAGSILGNWDQRMDMAWFSNVSAEAGSPGTVLARYAGTNLSGMLVDRRPDCSVVWIGAAGCLSPALLRNIALEAGLEPLMDNGSEVVIGAGLLGVVGTPVGGPQTVHLPADYVIESCLTGQDYQVTGRTLTFSLQPADIYGDVAVFSVAERLPEPPAQRSSVPAGLSAVGGDRKVILHWEAVPDAESYTLKVGFAPGGPYVPLATVEKTNYVDDNLTNGEPHYYVVSATGSSGDSDDSSEVSATPRAPLRPLFAVSQKNHGGGGVGEIPLAVFSGSNGSSAPLPVECRQGRDLEVVVHFDRLLVSGTAALAVGEAVLEAPPVIEGTRMKLTLRKVADGQTIQLRLSGVMAEDGSILEDGTVRFRVVLGDVDGDGSVSDQDLAAVRRKMGRPVSLELVREDLNLSGGVSSADVLLVRRAKENDTP